jgi:hypothetical protein
VVDFAVLAFDQTEKRQKKFFEGFRDMKIYLSLGFVWLMSQAHGWKPISHPASYSVIHDYPGSGGSSASVARSSASNVIHTDSVDTLFDSFHKNEVADDVSRLNKPRELREEEIGMRCRQSHSARCAPM